MKLAHRLVGTLPLLCLAGMVLFLAGCGNSPKNTSQPMDITSGTWTFTITPSSGSGGTITAKFTTFSCSENNIPLGPEYIISTLTGTVCVSTSSISGYGAEGLVLGLGANPVAANSTTTISEGFVEIQDKSGNYDVFDVTGTFTANSKTASGSYSPDPACTCSGQVGGTFNGTMN